jgi:hypothetical protein
MRIGMEFTSERLVHWSMVWIEVKPVESNLYVLGRIAEFGFSHITESLRGMECFILS